MSNELKPGIYDIGDGLFKIVIGKNDLGDNSRHINPICNEAGLKLFLEALQKQGFKLTDNGKDNEGGDIPNTP